MSDERTPLLFVSEPKRFMDLVMTDDPRERLDGLTNFDDIAICKKIDRVNAAIHGLGTGSVQAVLEGLRLATMAALRMC
jgi:hypothetical protein